MCPLGTKGIARLIDAVDELVEENQRLRGKSLESAFEWHIQETCETFCKPEHTGIHCPRCVDARNALADYRKGEE